MTDSQQTAGDSTPLPVLTRAVLRERINTRRAGTWTDAALAGWAFKQFYDEDLGLLTFEEDADEEIRDVLDALMFADEPTFALDDAALDALLQQLQP